MALEFQPRLSGDLIELVCEKCSRRGAHRKHTLIERFGPRRLAAWSARWHRAVSASAAALAAGRVASLEISNRDNGEAAVAFSL